MEYNITEVYLVAILKNTDEFNADNDRYLHDVCLCYRDTGEICQCADPAFASTRTFSRVTVGIAAFPIEPTLKQVCNNP